MITEFIGSNQNRREAGGLAWGVEPICAVLTEHGIAVARWTYYRQVNGAVSDREYWDSLLANSIRRVHAANYGLYGARKVWLVLNQEGIPVARCTVERLMRDEHLSGRCAARSNAPPALIHGRPGRRIWRSASSPQQHRIGCGSPT